MSQPSAEVLRERGNELYRSGEVEEALEHYIEAYGQAGDLASLKNISAAYFELGEYRNCIKTTKEAMDIAKAAGDRKSVSKMEARTEKVLLMVGDEIEEQQRDRRCEILEKLVRYRPSMRQAKELFPMGHDNLEAFFSEFFKEYDDPTISYFYGGIGDQRNLFRILLDINHKELNDGSPKRKYHLTVVDINQYTLARNLIVLKLLDQLSRVDRSSDTSTEILTTLFHVWASYLMPYATFQHLQQIIGTLLKSLKSGEQVIEWLYIPEEDKPHYIEVLQEWQRDQLHTNKDFVTKLVERNEQRVQRNELFGANPSRDATLPYGPEKNLFTQIGVVLPSIAALNTQDPYMTHVFDACTRPYTKRWSDNFVTTVKQHVIQRWKINVTIISREWYTENGWAGTFTCDPYNMVGEIYWEGRYPKKPEDAKMLYEYVTPLFAETATAIANLRGRFCVEAVLGDCVDVMEKVKFGLYSVDANTNRNGQKKPHASYRPAEFPALYDRFHLSNVPDYIGGHLSTFLHATPLLKSRKTSVAISCCLRNAFAYTSMLHYIADHNLISSISTLEKLTNTTSLRDATMESHLKFYNFFQLVPSTASSFKRPFSELLPKEDTQRWLYQLFFKIVAPYKCHPDKTTHEIHAALNLTVFFRMLAHLRTIGYPSHWLSEVLLSILSGDVTTTARPPRENPNTIAGVSKVHPRKKLCTAPFLRESATLTQLFSPLLPFAVSPSTDIPRLEDIRKYTFYLSSYSFPRYRTLTNLLLVFYDPALFAKISGNFTMDSSVSLRSFVDEDWIDNDAAKRPVNKADFEEIQEEGLIAWTTFEFDVKTLTATLWIEEGVVERMKEGGWAVGLWRVDEWAWACESVHRVGDVGRKREKWVGGNSEEGEKKLAGEVEKLGL